MLGRLVPNPNYRPSMVVGRRDICMRPELIPRAHEHCYSVTPYAGCWLRPSIDKKNLREARGLEPSTDDAKPHAADAKDEADRGLSGARVSLPLQSWVAHRGWCGQVQFAPLGSDFKVLSAGGMDGAVALWDTSRVGRESGRPLELFRDDRAHDGGIFSMHWSNGGGVLTSRFKRLPDDRTDAERAFPEMFVDTLRKKGWSETKHTPVSVLNPEHPNFVGKKKP